MNPKIKIDEDRILTVYMQKSYGMREEKGIYLLEVANPKSNEEHIFTAVVECLHHGQLRRYGDSEYSFDITSDASDEVVLAFCTSYLHPCKSTYAKWKENISDANSYFDGYYAFHGSAENGYNYLVHEPYDD